MSEVGSTIQFIKTFALFDEPRTILIDKDGTIVARANPKNWIRSKTGYAS